MSAHSFPMRRAPKIRSEIVYIELKAEACAEIRCTDKVTTLTTR